ncbi:MAG: PcfJ domain-containing protein [Parasphingorhabdus sp.]|uniref:PcfJ domain-containing protein n=1 Tax=Parasphingorhabdus sp. TaxID=2709688 RepID=UPI003298FDBF
MTAKNHLQVLGKDFVPATFLVNESWVPESVARAQQLFPNQGMHRAATLLAALHPHAIEYLETAPVLALAASFGGKTQSKADRAYIAMNFGPMMENGLKLKKIMEKARVAYPLRAISANAIRPGVWNILQDISRLVDPSSMAQSIPDDPVRHTNWLGDLHSFWNMLKFRGDTGADAALLRWAMFALARPGRTQNQHVGPSEVADYLVCNKDEFSTRWTWDRIISETQAWHEALANADIDKINDGTYDAEIDYGRFPDLVSIGGYDFHALRSLRALVIEGKAMKHCVASFYRDIERGRCNIYSARKDGKRVATVEYMSIPTIRPVQMKGPCNSGVDRKLHDAASQFGRAMRYPDKARGLPKHVRDQMHGGAL